MNSLIKAPSVSTDVVGPKDATGVVLWIEKKDFTALLEQALASARRPNLLAIPTFAMGIVLPILLAMEAARQNSADFDVVTLVGVSAMALAVGTYLGRWLRPTPNANEIQEFSAKLAAAGACTDYVEESRQVANRLTGGAEWRQLPAAGGACIVDHAAILAINQISADHVHFHRSQGLKPIVITTKYGSREFFSENVKCAECSNAVDVLHNGDGFCSVCISPLCEDSQTKQRQSDGTLRCPACADSSYATAAAR